MGRLEKIVVVTVLFLVAVILGISLNSDSDETQGGTLARDKRGARRAAGLDAAQAPAKQPDAAGVANPNGASSTTPGGAMNSVVGGNPLSPQPGSAPAASPSVGSQQPTDQHSVAPGDPAGNSAAGPERNSAATSERASNPPAQAAASIYILSKDGLEPTSSEDFMHYTWKAGDTFRALAQKFYGSPLHVARLRAANEGRDEAQLAIGDKILVSVQPASTAGVALSANRDNSAKAAGAALDDGTYTVKSGDVLGTISKSVYGTSKHWKKIYDANKDVIGDDANKLKVGTKLRIPQI